MKSLEELKALRDKARAEMGMRHDADDAAVTRVVVGMATCGIAAGARPVLQEFTKKVAEENLSNVIVSQTGCIGICQYEPVVEVYSPKGDKTTYIKMDAKKADEVVKKHLRDGKVVAEYTIGKENI